MFYHKTLSHDIEIQQYVFLVSLKSYNERRQILLIVSSDCHKTIDSTKQRNKIY